MWGRESRTGLQSRKRGSKGQLSMYAQHPGPREATLRSRYTVGRLVSILVALAALASRVSAQQPANVLVVTNAASAASVRIGDAYQKARLIPADQVLPLQGIVAADEIDRAEYEHLIEAPLAKWLTAHQAQDRIVAIVLTKGIPLRIRGTGGPDGTVSSVDSELTLLYRRLTGAAVPVAGSVQNPYFLDAADPRSAASFTHERFDIYLVTRLDGFTEEDVLGLIRRAATPSKEGRFVLDEKVALLGKGNDWLQLAADRLTQAGMRDRVILESTARVATGLSHVLGYYSWGSNDPSIRIRHFGLQFEAGAIGAMFVSTDGRTLTAPAPEWQIGSWDDRSSYYAGSPQSLMGDLIHDGITGIAGHVSEPYLRATIRPDILFPAYVAGRSLAEAFYLAMPALSWQTIVVGDPLCAPFASTAIQNTSLDPGIDDSTQMPRWFSGRRLGRLSAVTKDSRALRFLLRAETLFARDDKAAARALLEEATDADPALAGTHAQLAAMYEEAGDYAKATERYRKILALNPDDVFATNNLAFLLAVRANAPTAALPLAERARKLAPNSPEAADTLGWILVLLGRPAEAIPVLADAMNGAPKSGEIALHLARAYVDTGSMAEARTLFDKALALDPTLAGSPDAARIKQALK
jgi:uncharacterized protein (TIGR03790 family)